MWHRTRGIDLRIFPEMMCAGYEDGHKDACVVRDWTSLLFVTFVILIVMFFVCDRNLRAILVVLSSSTLMAGGLWRASHQPDLVAPNPDNPAFITGSQTLSTGSSKISKIRNSFQILKQINCFCYSFRYFDCFLQFSNRFRCDL